MSSSSDNVSQGDYIFVARAGGILNYVGHDIVASDPEFQLSHLNEEYLFFGRRIGPDLYKVDSEHVLLLKNGLVAETTTHVHHPDLYGNISKSQLLREVYAAADLLKSNQTSRGEQIKVAVYLLSKLAARLLLVFGRCGLVDAGQTN